MSEASQALLVAMRGSGDFCRIEIVSDFDFAWEVGVAWAEVTTHRPHDCRPYVIVRPPGAAGPNLDQAIEGAHHYWRSNRNA